MGKRGRKKKNRLPSLRLKPDTVKTIFFIFFLVTAILSVFSFLQTGTSLNQYNQVLTKLFGFASFLIPFLLLLISFNFTKLKSPLREPNVFLGFMIMFFSTIIPFQQGVVGRTVWSWFASILSQLASYFVFFFSFIVGFVVLFDTNVLQIIKSIKNTFLIIKKYTVGNISRSKNKKSQIDNDLSYVQTGLNISKDQSSEKSRQDDPVTVGIPPVLKTNKSNPIIIGGNQVDNPSSHIWEYPTISIFDNTPGAKADRGDVRKNAQTIEQTLESFGITAKVKEVNNSPSVTQYALEVALGTKLAKILSLSNDMAMALAAPGGQIRVEAPIPGRSYVGIEVPNRSLEVVPIRQVMESEAMKQAKSKLTIPLGLDVAGHPKVGDIAKMPHVIIAGQTGSGKSICINSWISTLLYRCSPDELKLILVDPKRVELTPYNNIPHLLCPVIVEPEKVVSALKWAVEEMTTRYKKFTEVGAKNIESYNTLAGFQSLPYIVIFIDELADIMLFSPSEVEENICRIAQMARAVGIHLVLATQRPSVNIITGLIKANVPTRIAFAVSSMIDSRVVLDTPGAEKLLGRGDMLFIPPELAKPVRVQGCFISDREINRLVDFVKSQKTGEYDNQITSLPVKSPTSLSPNINVVDGKDRDAVYDAAIELITNSGRASASLFQRHLKLGYARAARLLDQLQANGVVGPVHGAKPRQILIPHANPSDEALE